MKLKVQPLFFLYFLTIAVFSSVWACGAALLALLIHEAAHLAVGHSMGERIESIELTPFGGIIHYSSGASPHKGVKGVAVAAAGPLANYALIGLMSFPEMQLFLPYYFIRQAILMNAGMMFLNLLPVLPLDGGRIVFYIGYYVLPVGVLTSILSFGGMAVGIIMTGLSLYGTIEFGKINLSLLLVGGYLAVYAYRNRGIMFSENMYTLLQERQENGKTPTAVRVYRVDGKTELLALVGTLANNEAVVFRVGNIWLDDRQVISALLHDPNMTVEEALKKTNNSDENYGNDLKHTTLCDTIIHENVEK